LTGVIDWVKATIADPAFDYGAVLAILATVPIRVPTGLHRTMRALMNNLARTHSRRCRSLPESEAALRYYQIFNCVVQLVTVGRSRAQERTSQGVYNSPVGVANLINHVHRLTCVWRIADLYRKISNSPHTGSDNRCASTQDKRSSI
jgi:aminoglycoside phosphotransferase (APT) family kinase protein